MTTSDSHLTSRLFPQKKRRTKRENVKTNGTVTGTTSSVS